MWNFVVVALPSWSWQQGDEQTGKSSRVVPAGVREQDAGVHAVAFCLNLCWPLPAGCRCNNVMYLRGAPEEQDMAS